MEDALSYIGTFLAGGGLVYFIDFWRYSGSVKLDQYNVKIKYSQNKDLRYFLISFDLDLQFMNTSGQAKSVRGLTACFHQDNNFHELKFKDYNTPPAVVLGANDIKCFQCVLLPYEKNMEILMTSIHKNTSHIEITYKIKKREKKLIIKGGEFELIDKTFIVTAC